MNTVDDKRVSQTGIEEALWTEMLGRWKQILKAVAAKRVSAERAFEIFREAFAEKVDEIDKMASSSQRYLRIWMLWRMAQENPTPFVDEYFQWLQESPLKKLFEGVSEAQTQIVESEHLLQTLQDTLSTLSWWDSLWKTTELESQIDDAAKQLRQWNNALHELAPRIRSELDKWSCGGAIRLPQKFWTIECVDEMVYIPSGTFTMGALEDDRDAYISERPRHMVTLTQDFWMGKYPVTQALWEGVKGFNRSVFNGPNRPVENVSWFDVVRFCNQLSHYEGLDPVYQIDGTNVTCDWKAKGYRLPTEAEWEYCARAGQDFKFSGSDTLRSVAWYAETSLGTTHPVGEKKPNVFGLYDMTGNVWEWVWDWMHRYRKPPLVDPRGPKKGTLRIERGGGWRHHAHRIRISRRSNFDPMYSGDDLGFRLCRNM